jgi:hypothetical protein
MVRGTDWPALLRALNPFCHVGSAKKLLIPPPLAPPPGAPSLEPLSPDATHTVSPKAAAA